MLLSSLVVTSLLMPMLPSGPGDGGNGGSKLPTGGDGDGFGAHGLPLELWAALLAVCITVGQQVSCHS